MPRCGSASAFSPPSSSPAPSPPPRSRTRWRTGSRNSSAGSPTRTDPLADRVAELVRRLSDEDFAVRQAAYDELAALGEEALPYLDSALSSGDPDVERMVRRLVDSVRHRSRQDLLAGLSDDEEDFRKTPAFRDLASKGRAILPALYEALDEEDSRYPQYDYRRFRNAWCVIGALVGPEDLDHLLDRLRSPNIQHRILLESILRDMDQRLVHDRVLGRLADEDGDPQARAHLVDMCLSSSFTGDDQRFPTILVALVDDPAPLVRASALRYLMIRRDDGSAARVLARARDEDPTVRAAALRALMNYRQPESIAALLSGLDDPSPEVRAAALQSLQGAGGPDLAPRIRPFLRDPDPTVRSSAAQLLSNYGDRSAIPALLALLDERSTDFLQRTLHSVVDALGRLEEPAAVDPLLRLLEDAKEDETIANYRYLILRALLQIGKESMLERLRPMLTDRTIQNLHVPLDEVARIGSDKVVPILMDALANGDRHMRTSAARALADRGVAAAAPLIAAALAEESEPWTLTECVRALTVLGYREAVPRLLPLLERDPADQRQTSLFYALFRALMRFEVRESAPRLARIARESPSCHNLAVEALSVLAGPGSLPDLRALLAEEKSESLRHRLAIALAGLGEPDALLARVREIEKRDRDSSQLVEYAEALIALGRPAEARAAAEKVRDGDNGTGVALYNAACLFALLGDREEALALLSRALKVRPFMRDQAASDPDLRSLVDDPRFAEALRQGK